jgi:hypothetical protein
LNSRKSREIIAGMTLETELTLRCCECGSEIDDLTALSFRGALGCEKCVRSYYRDRPAEVEFELKCRRTEAIDIVKYERKKLEKLAVKKTAADKRTALVTAELQELVLHCFECGAEINVSTAFAFGGNVACEKCVRDYYRSRPAEVEIELQTRRRNAVAWVKRNRRTLEKQAAKR